MAFGQGSNRSSEGGGCQTVNRNIGLSTEGNGVYCLDAWDGNDFIDISFKNFGLDTIVSVTYSYEYDGTTYGPVVATMNLQTGMVHQTPLAIPNITSGSHDISVWVLDVNGMSDQCNQNDSLLYQFSTVTASSIQSPLADTVVCRGESHVFNADSSFSTYLWSNGSTASSLQVMNSGVYKVQLIDDQGCVRIDSALVSNYPVVKPLGDLDTSVCSSMIPYTITLSGSYSSVVWNNQTLGNSFTAQEAGDFQLSYQDSFGCAGVDSLHLKVHQLVDPNLAQTHVFCDGDSVELELHESFTTYAWSNSKATPSVTVSNAGQYSVILTDSNGCEQTAVTQVLKQDLPSILWNTDSVLCKGEFLQLQVGNHNAYQWSTGSSAPSIQITSPGVYTVSVTDSVGCANSDAFEVVEKEATVELGEDTAICDGSLIFLSPMGNYDQLLWNKTTISNSLSIGQAGEFTVEATQFGKCIARDTIKVSSIAFPYADFTSQSVGNSVLFTNFSSSYDSLLWTFGDGVTSSDENPSHAYLTPGIYLTKLTASNVCGMDSYEQQVRVIQTNDVELEQRIQVSLSPNPTYGQLRIQVSGYTSTLDYEVVNAIGQYVLLGQLNPQTGMDETIDLSSFSRGTYFLRLHSEELQETHQVILK